MRFPPIGAANCCPQAVPKPCEPQHQQLRLFFATHALFAEQSHSIPDNLVALLRHSRAWNCSSPERMTAERVIGSTVGWLNCEALSWQCPLLLYRGECQASP